MLGFVFASELSLMLLRILATTIVKFVVFVSVGLV